MNTGMTRGYKRERFLALPLEEDEKEMHLEIVSKALAFGYHVYEIPSILEWKAHDHAPKTKKKRKSSAKINKLIRTHLVFSLIAAPFRYIFLFSILCALTALIFLGSAVYHLFTPTPSVFLAFTAFFLILFLSDNAFPTLSLGIKNTISSPP